MAGESPGKSEQRKSSGETTASERDPRLAVFRDAEADDTPSDGTDTDAVIPPCGRGGRAAAGGGGDVGVDPDPGAAVGGARTGGADVAGARLRADA